MIFRTRHTQYITKMNSNQQMNSNHQAYMGEFSNINQRLDDFRTGLVNHGVNIPFVFRRENRRCQEIQFLGKRAMTRGLRFGFDVWLKIWWHLYQFRPEIYDIHTVGIVSKNRWTQRGQKNLFPCQKIQF